MTAVRLFGRVMADLMAEQIMRYFLQNLSEIGIVTVLLIMQITAQT